MKVDLHKYNIQHWDNISTYMNGVKRIFFQAMDKMAKIYGNLPTTTQFNLAAMPAVRVEIEKELLVLARSINGIVVNGNTIEWSLSNRKNDELVKELLQGRPIPVDLNGKLMARNLEALKSFNSRVVSGMNLSERVWDIVKIEANSLELHMALGIYEGTPAAKLANEMKASLNNSTALFRRVRDAEGNLQLSKPMEAYNPGQGVYRSAYKNALRMTRTETNFAYQKSDNLRWESMDFVLGVKVQRSGRGAYPCSICDSAVGNYPKDYNWTALHANCLCYATPILASEDDFLSSLDAEDDGGSYDFSGYVTQQPESFIDFKSKTGFEHYGH